MLQRLAKTSFALTLMALFCPAFLMCSYLQAQAKPNAAERKSAAKQEDKKLTKLHIKVTSGDTAEPVPGARVEVTLKGEGGPYRVGRTDLFGVTEVEVPSVTVDVQVTAPHFDTGGLRVTLQGEQQKPVEIKLKKRQSIDPS